MSNLRSEPKAITVLISPQTQILNVAESLVKQLYAPAARHRQSGIKSTAKQLQCMLMKHFAGELPPLRDDGCPF